MMNTLIPLENVNAIELFSNEKTIQSMLDEIKKQATDFDADVSTPTGRKDIAAQAYKVSRSKTVIDNAGKELTQEWAKKKKVVDAGRRLARDFCDNLRDEIRQPLTDYEAEEAKLAAVAAQKAEMEADELAAYAENDLIDREAKVKEYEARIEAERIESERAEADRIAEEQRKENDERIRKEAKERAEREASEAVERAEREAAEAEQRIKDQAEQAERDRVEAEQRAEREKKEAIEREQLKAKEDAELKERDRLRLIEDEKIESQRRAANTENRRKINNSIVDALVAGGISKTTAKKAVVLIASGNVPAVSIRY